MSTRSSLVYGGEESLGPTGAHVEVGVHIWRDVLDGSVWIETPVIEAHICTSVEVSRATVIVELPPELSRLLSEALALLPREKRLGTP